MRYTDIVGRKIPLPIIYVYTDLVGGPEVKRPLGRPRSRWKDNIKIGLQEVSYFYLRLAEPAG